MTARPTVESLLITYYILSVTDGVDVAGQVEHLVGEAPLVVVPSHELYEVVVKRGKH